MTARDTTGARRPRGSLVWRAGQVSVRSTRRSIVIWSVLAALIVAVSVWALMLGTLHLTPSEVAAAFTGNTSPIVTKVVLGWRLPRVVAALLFGALLAVGGAVFQSLTRNPLGSPDVIGFSAGSYTGVVVVIILGASSALSMAAGALIGGFVTAFLVYGLAFRGGIQGFRLIVVGIGVGAFLTGVNSWFSVKADAGAAMRAALWGAGSLTGIDPGAVRLAAVGAAVLACCAPWVARRLGVLALGDETAAMLGVSVERSKTLVIAFAVVATALVTAAAGPISFIALAAPQVAKRLTARSDGVDLLGSALVGSLLLLASDLVAQHAVPGIDLPTGAVTVCLGGAYLVWLLARETRHDARGTA